MAVSAIQKEVNSLKEMILFLGTEVEGNLQLAAKALLEQDSKLARRVKEKDHEIDNTEINVEETCLKILALKQPVAGDLRFVVTVLKINNDLERIGDLAAKIADKVLLLDALGNELPHEISRIHEKFRGMFETTNRMVKDSLDAFVHEDADLAYKVCVWDDAVDEDKQSIRNEIEEILAHEPAYHLLMARLLGASRCLERIADHATNICEDIIYMLQGKIIRHKIDEIAGTED